MDVAKTLEKLCLAPAPSGYEKECAHVYENEIKPYVDSIEYDRMGNVIAKVEGTDPEAPKVMVFAHLDTLGFIVRRIEPTGFIQVDRLGGIPEKVLPGLKLKIRTTEGKFVSGVFGNKSHHTASADEKYKVDVVTSLFIDVGASSAEEVHEMGIEIGCPVIYEPSFTVLNEKNGMVCGTAMDNRGGVAALITAAAAIKESGKKPVCTTYFVGTVWEEFNIRGAVFAARKVKADIALCLDVVMSGDTADLAGKYETRLGEGPTVNFYNFHGRGTLNGTIAHEGLSKLAIQTAKDEGMAFQRFASLGMLTDLAYVQMENQGIASLDMGFPCRYTHTPVEVCCVKDVEGLGKLVAATVLNIKADFNLNRYN